MEKVEFLFTVVSVRTSKDEEYIIVKGYDKHDNIVTAFAKNDEERDLPSVGDKAIANNTEYKGEIRIWLA